MSETEKEAALLAVRSNVGLCPACNGNDGNMPCAYPGEGKQGCMLEARRASSDRNRQAEYLRSCFEWATRYKGA